MKTLLAPFALLFLTACASIRVAPHPTERLPKGAIITLHMVNAEGAGLEHAIAEALSQAGFDVRSQATVSAVVRTEDSAKGDGTERIYRYHTAYACRVKAMGWGSTVSSFTLQILHVSTGKIVLSMSGQEGGWSAASIAEELKKQLAASAPTKP